MAVSTADPIDPIGPTVTDSIDPSDVTHRPATGSLAIEAPVGAGLTLPVAATARTSRAVARRIARMAAATVAATDPRAARPGIALISPDPRSRHAPTRAACRSGSIRAGSAS